MPPACALAPGLGSAQSGDLAYAAVTADHDAGYSEDGRAAARATVVGVAGCAAGDGCGGDRGRAAGDTLADGQRRGAGHHGGRYGAYVEPVRAGRDRPDRPES